MDALTSIAGICFLWICLTGTCQELTPYKMTANTSVVLWVQVEWAHVDIAGPAWDEKAGGATGFGALTLAQWAAAQGSA